jgi:SIR2-like domain
MNLLNEPVEKLSREGPIQEIVLLGAGASIEAGIPSALGMTEAVVETLASEFGDILTYVIGALQFQRAIGGNLTVGQGHRIDVEALANAVDLLANRLSLEIAPFVTAWHPRLLELQGATVQHRRLPGEIFKSRSELLRRLLPLDVLEISEAPNLEAAEYLMPLLQGRHTRQERFTIATLNYDPLIEWLADSHAIPVDTGLNTWLAEGLSGPIATGVVLLKLHGSTDWWFDADDNVVSPRPAPDDNGPALLFGGNNKLTARGPFLDLLMAFRTELNRSHRLTTVGYSFRDLHVNEYISRWFSTRAFRQVRIIDPAAHWANSLPHVGDVRVPLPPLSDLLDRVELMPYSASEGLKIAFPA